MLNPAEIFAERLVHNGVKLRPLDETTIEVGAKISGRSIDGKPWKQGSANWTNDAFGVECLHALADRISDEAKELRLGHLWLPKEAVGARWVANDVSLRQWQVDHNLTRLDVLYSIP